MWLCDRSLLNFQAWTYTVVSRCCMNTYQTFRDDFFNKVANVFKPTFSLYVAIDSCGCVIALFLGLRHGPTLLSHDVVRKPIKLSGTNGRFPFEFLDGGVI